MVSREQWSSILMEVKVNYFMAYTSLLGAGQRGEFDLVISGWQLGVDVT